MAYLIPCSSKKNCLLIVNNTQVSNLSNLTSFNCLYNFRLELIKKLKINLNWNVTKPAYEVYNGKIYKQIDKNNWCKKTTDIIIVSALFGLIRPNELIPYYNVKMDDKLPNTNTKISTFWFENKLINYLPFCPLHVDLLTKKYRNAFNKNNAPIGQFVNNNIWKDNYGIYKGKWLNSQLILNN